MYSHVSIEYQFIFDRTNSYLRRRKCIVLLLLDGYSIILTEIMIIDFVKFKQNLFENKVNKIKAKVYRKWSINNIYRYSLNVAIIKKKT